MNAIQERLLNQTAYRQLTGFIQQAYLPGRFLAISGGKIVADAGSFEELDHRLNSSGEDSTEVLVVQAGVEYPESALIFLPGLPS